MLTQKTTKGNYYSTQLSPVFLYSHLFKMQTNLPRPDLFSPISECQTLRELLAVKSSESVETRETGHLAFQHSETSDFII